LFGSELDFQLLSSPHELVPFGNGSASGLQSSSRFGFHEARIIFSRALRGSYSVRSARLPLRMERIGPLLPNNSWPSIRQIKKSGDGRSSFSDSAPSLALGRITNLSGSQRLVAESCVRTCTKAPTVGAGPNVCYTALSSAKQKSATAHCYRAIQRKGGVTNIRACTCVLPDIPGGPYCCEHGRTITLRETITFCKSSVSFNRATPWLHL
jgi:hypothetical protein